VRQNSDHRPANVVALARISDYKSHIPTDLLHVAYTNCIATGIGNIVVIDQTNRYVCMPLRSTETLNKWQQRLRLCQIYASSASYSEPHSEYHLGYLSAKGNWQICCARSGIMRLKLYANDYPVH
jgi:hypothetical protein